MHFLPFVSAILATAVLVTSEPSAQSDLFEIIAVNGDTPSTDKLQDGNLAGNGVPGSQSPAAESEIAPPPRPVPEAPQQSSPQGVDSDARQPKFPPQEVSPYGQQQQSLPSEGNPYGRQRNSLPEGSTSPPPGYQGDQHCRQYGGCPFECHTSCVCWEWCKNAKCNLAVFGEQALTSAQLSCDPRAGEKFIGNVCRPYCANWCEDMKNQIVQVLSSEQEQRAFLSRPLECDKNYYYCPSDPNPSGFDCLKAPNPLSPGTGGSGGPSGYQQQPGTSGSGGPSGYQQEPRFPPGSNQKELDKTNTPDITEFPLDDLWSLE